jgi:endoglucanase
MNIEEKEFVFREFGVSGREERIKKSIEMFASQMVDEIVHDVTGSLICVKRGSGRNRKTVMINAHMDTIGFIITYIDEKGFLRFSEIGSHPRAWLLGKTVIFENSTTGVIGIERKEHEKTLPVEKMFIDIGAVGKEDAMKRARVGDVAAVYSPCRVNERVISGGWLDDRVGCLVLLEVMQNITKIPNDLFFVFSVQEEVGLRGATTASYAIQPDVGLVVDVTASSDLPEGEPEGSCAFGNGAGIKIMDRSVIVPKRFTDFLCSLAARNKIPFQKDVLRKGSTDAHAIQLSRGGVLTGGVSIPVRYIHSAGELCSVDDVLSCIRLVHCFCEEDLARLVS